MLSPPGRLSLASETGAALIAATDVDDISDQDSSCSTKTALVVGVHTSQSITIQAAEAFDPGLY